MEHFPRNLYFDTNVLRSLSFAIHRDPRLSEIRQRLNETGGKIFVSRIVLEESIYLHVAEMKKGYDQLVAGQKKFSQYVPTERVRLELPAYVECLQLVREQYMRHLAEAEIEVYEVDYRAVDVAELVESAVKHKKPFSPDDRGFKDAVILRSVIAHSVTTPASNDIFVTTNTADFDHTEIAEDIRKNGARIELMFALSQAQKSLEALVDGIVSKHFVDREEALRTFLLQQTPTILEFIKSQGIRPSFLTDGYLGSSLVRVLDLSILDVKDPSASFPKDSSVQETVPVSFTVHVKVRLLVKRTFYGEPKVPIRNMMQEDVVVGVPFIPESEDFQVETEKDMLVFGEIVSTPHNDSVAFSSLTLKGASEKGVKDLIAEMLAYPGIVTFGTGE